ncbi:PspC domain-containing protein [Paucibacter soli]|uniref:PspC domain-containing protein n=1 Tax=Paucibacter soli TaxID=3133433 RepID=UPI0030A5C44A
MSMSNELERLAELHRNGQLSDAEYAKAKARVLDDGSGGGASGDAPGYVSGAAVNSFRRSRSDRWLGGVCAGLGRLTGLESWIWRLAFVLMAVCAGTGVLAYLLLWIFVPEE